MGDADDRGGGDAAGRRQPLRRGRRGGGGGRGAGQLTGANAGTGGKGPASRAGSARRVSGEEPGEAPPVLPEGHALLALGEVDSTLDEAARRLAEISGPTWITATRQTAGRGRRGRPWVSPPGNFAATLVLPGLTPGQGAALRSFVAALALFEACTVLGTPPDRLALKWPNDVLLDGGKLAGILLEGLAAGGRIEGLAIGIGVNLAAAPPPEALEPGALAPVALADCLGTAPAPAAFLEALAPAFARWEGQFRAGGFGPIRAAWLARAARLGEAVTARLPGEEVRGIFRDVDGEGHLVLSTPRGARRIAAGEIFF
ncbi:MAG: biotin--[acetyl-CoA-carboxylase] ligase [Alphaproteobacteria bacterium]|nr:MAG: biotin--[acetyl-CoA-carboxylase] ligase [Alphaproteobacteria bacterium]